MAQESLLILDVVMILVASYVAYECIREKEQRAGILSTLGIGFHVVLLYITIYLPSLISIVYGYYTVLTVGLVFFLIPRSPNIRAQQGLRGYEVDAVVSPDERDNVGSRKRLQLGTEEYKRYYEKFPELEEEDKIRREVERVGGIVDGGYRPNMAMSRASFKLPYFMTPIAYATPLDDIDPQILTAEKATMIVKNLAQHLGAKLVGVCKVDPMCIYSHSRTTRQDKWTINGEEVDYPPYAIVMATEMNHEHVNSAPHTPTAAETANQYANGAYISTVIAHWFSGMGYTGIAEHTGHYDAVLPPLAVQAGLGEVGRNGYLITPGMGGRVRLCAVLTDMPLVMDKPRDMGVEEFCRNCMKCAKTCPSKSISEGEMVIHRGVEKWKVNGDTCSDYWDVVGTDCAICMAICPFSRPNTPIHTAVRWFVKHSHFAPRFFPIFDDLLYGTKWKPKPVSDWLKYD